MFNPTASVPGSSMVYRCHPAWAGLWTTLKVPALPESAVGAVPLAGGGEERLEQRDPLPAGHHGIVDETGHLIVALASWRASRSHHLFGRLEAGRRS